MKRVIRILATNIVGLFVLTQMISSIKLSGDFRTYASTAAVLSALQLVVRPILELVLLPVNLLTMGMFRWVSATVILWMTTRLTSHFVIEPFYFEGVSYRGAMLPDMMLSGMWTLVLASFLLSLVASTIEWIWS